MSSGRGLALDVALYTTAFILPSAAVWGVLALGLGLLVSLVGFIVPVAWIYAVVYGTFEVLSVPIRPPSTSWQVPAGWLKERPALVQALIWGVSLGPGILTRNPYAGMWLLPVLLIFPQVTSVGFGLGLLVGAAHGGARAFGILSTRRYARICGGDRVLLTQWRWRLADGLMLVAGAGLVAGMALSAIHH